MQLVAQARTAVLMVLVLTVLTGIVYPLALTGVAGVLFPFQAREQRLGFRPSVGLDHADHHIGAGFQLGLCTLQHLVRLADAGGGADEDLEPAGLIVLAPRRFEQRVR